MLKNKYIIGIIPIMYLNYYNYFVDIHLNLLGYFPISTCFARASMVEDDLDKVFENQAISY